jgi:RNA polymerase sigma factor (sigma-70 family)
MPTKDFTPKCCPRLTDDQKQLASEHIRLVYHYAKEYAASHHDASIEDLRQAGVMGLLYSVTKFDPAHGVKFGAFASSYIQFAISHEARNSKCPLSMSLASLHLLSVAQRTSALFMNKHGRYPTREEIEELSGRRISKSVFNMMCSRVWRASDFSESVREEDDVEFTHALDCDIQSRYTTFDCPEDICEYRSMLIWATEQLTGLNDRERLVMQMRCEGGKRKDIGAEIGISHERVRQIEKTAIAKLRKQAELEGML